MPTESRQTLGQFRTPSEVGELMRTWATSDAETVLDPGLGAGGLSSPRHPFWIMRSDPTQVVDVVGIDRSPLALLMGTTALTLAGQAHEPRITDFLDLVPEDLSTSVDALVCNPPYTSTEALPAEYKHDINTRLERETGRDISKASPLYAYFLYHAREFLSPGARAAFITPQSFLATNYGEPLKEFLLDEFDIQALLLVDPTSDPVFDEVMTTGLITFLKATAETDATGCTRFIRVDETPSLNTLQAAVNDGQQGPTDWGYINCVPQREVTPERNWQALFDPSTFDTTGLTPLSEFVTVHRGVTTGNTGFFCLSQDTVDQRGLDEQHLSRLARWSRCIDGYEFRDEDWEQLQTTGAETWLFDPDTLDGVPDTVQAFSDRIADESISVTDTQSAETDSATNIRAYLREGVTSYDLDTTDAVKNRPYWYRPKRQESARVLVTYASRDGFTFILNEADVRHINSLYGFYDVTVDETELKALLAYLNSDVATEACREQQRARQGGFEQLEPNKLEAVLVIDPTALPDDIVTTLAAAFDTLRETVRRGDDPDPVIDRIDTILQQEL